MQHEARHRGSPDGPSRCRVRRGPAAGGRQPDRAPGARRGRPLGHPPVPPRHGPGPAESSPGTAPDTLRRAAAQLDEYFAGARTSFDLPFGLCGTPFQVEVWRALAGIDYGTTITYGELAGRVGRPTAYRAVGQANGANPLPIFFPCHRVVASGGLGGYGGGLDVKRRLLALEGWSADGGSPDRDPT